MKNTIRIALLVIATGCFVSILVLSNLHPYDEIKSTTSALEWTGLAMLWIAIFIQKRNKPVATQDSKDFATKYPATPRGVFKRILFWLSIFSGIPAIFLLVMHPTDPIAFKIIEPMMGVAVTALVLHAIMVNMDKAKS